MSERYERMDISVGTGIFAALGRQDVKTDQIFREFIDNSTSSYFDHIDTLKDINKDSKCHVEISWDDDQIIIRDDAFGMNITEFNNALKINAKAKSYSEQSRGQYGLGLKYAISSLGKWFKIESRAFGSGEMYTVEVDIDQIEKEQPNELPFLISECDKSLHGTRITIQRLTKKLNNTVGSIAKTKSNKVMASKVDDLIKKLARIYKQDIENGDLEIRVNSLLVKPVTPEYLQKETGGEYFTTFSGKFLHKEKEYEYTGWLGILKVGSVSDAGLTLIQKGRAIQINYRPESIFGKSNDFRYQRVIGEIELEGSNWVVTFTKDAIKWDEDGLQETFLEDLYAIDSVRNMFKFAKEYRKTVKKLDNDKVKKLNLGEDFSRLSDIEKINVESKNTQTQEKMTDPVLDDLNNNIDDAKNREIIPITYEGIDYKFEIAIKNQDYDIKKWLKITVVDASKNFYCLTINDRVPLLEKYIKSESKELMLKMAICMALAQLSSERLGLKLTDSNKFIAQLNTIMNNVKQE